MSRELIYLPAASQDLVEGRDYYEGLSPGTGGQRFENAFKEALRQIRAGLITHTIAFEDFHRVNLRRFPYALYYRLVGKSGDRGSFIFSLGSKKDPQRLGKTTDLIRACQPSDFIKIPSF